MIINVLMLVFSYMTLTERKVMGRMQLRYGPNRAGPYGLLQPFADLIKLIRKESFYPATAIDRLYIVSPASPRSPRSPPSPSSRGARAGRSAATASTAPSWTCRSR